MINKIIKRRRGGDEKYEEIQNSIKQKEAELEGGQTRKEKVAKRYQNTARTTK